MPEPTPIFIAVIGLGGVGKAFLTQLTHLRATLASKSSSPIDLRLVLARRSNREIPSFTNWTHLEPSSIPQLLESQGRPCLPLSECISQLSRAPGRAILVDNTSSPEIAQTYPLILSRGVSVVTPNKKAFSSDLDLWTGIVQAAGNLGGPKSNGFVFHESTVGAGLPVLSSLRDLIDTGDKVTKIEGVFSGTMSFLFNAFQPSPPSKDGSGGGKFSAEVKKAKELGFTEPDPRDDLNGLDVARKLTILARIVGLEVRGPTAFPVQSLIPKELESCASGDEFLERLPEFDGEMEELKIKAAKGGKVVRFVGSIDVAKKEVKVGLEEFEASHPIAALKGSDNIINFYTERYGANPLIIQGAGAGGDVTAMGVTADVIKVLRLLQ